MSTGLQVLHELDPHAPRCVQEDCPVRQLRGILAVEPVKPLPAVRVVCRDHTARRVQPRVGFEMNLTPSAVSASTTLSRSMGPNPRWSIAWPALGASSSLTA